MRSVFTDNDIAASGKKRRPRYEALLSDLAANAGTTVICWHTDRLYRHLAELENYIDIAKRHRIVTRAVRAGDLDLATAAGRMIARHLGVAARYELERMSERRRDGKARAAAAGRRKQGRLLEGVKSEWSAIVDESLWRGLVAALKDPSRRTTPEPERQ